MLLLKTESALLDDSKEFVLLAVVEEPTETSKDFTSSDEKAKGLKKLWAVLLIVATVAVRCIDCEHLPEPCCTARAGTHGRRY